MGSDEGSLMSSSHQRLRDFSSVVFDSRVSPKVWNTDSKKTGKCARSLVEQFLSDGVLEGHENSVFVFFFSPDSRLLASRNGDISVRI